MSRRMGDYNLAIKELEQSISLDPNLTFAYVELCFTHVETGDVDAAQQSLNRAFIKNNDCFTPEVRRVIENYV